MRENKVQSSWTSLATDRIVASNQFHLDSREDVSTLGGGSPYLLVRLGFSWLIVFLFSNMWNMLCGGKSSIIGLHNQQQSEIILSKDYSLHLVDRSSEIIF